MLLVVSHPVSNDAQPKEKETVMNEKVKITKMAARSFLAMTLLLTAANLLAQETRKLISNPAPAYPETAKRFRLTGVVKVQVLIAPDGQIKSTKVIGGHPLLVNAVEETLKNWKYAPSSAESTALLEFNFHP
jgi:TonB family protein